MASQPQSISLVLSRAKQTMQDEFNSRPKIQRVSPHLGEGDKYTKYYKPKLISIGPIHHGDSNLKRGEQYKLMWAAMFVEQNQQNPDVIHEKVLNEISYLRKLFSWDKIGILHNHYNDADLAFMLFVDGCSIIQILQKGNLIEQENLKIKLDQMIFVIRDLHLLENQLPYEVLKLLVDDEMKLKMSMCYFCVSQNMFTDLGSTNSFSPEQDEYRQRIDQYFPSIHLLDCLCKIILNDGTLAEQQVDQEIPTVEKLISELPMAFNWLYEKERAYKTIQELKADAIRVKKQSNVNLRNISFSSTFFGGKLHLPPLILDELAVPTLMNLVAYEMCSDFKNKFEISSYVKLLDFLIDRSEDVKELRDANILQFTQQNDEELSQFFNTIGSELVQDQTMYSMFQSEIQVFNQSKLNMRKLVILILDRHGLSLLF